MFYINTFTLEIDALSFTKALTKLKHPTQKEVDKCLEQNSQFLPTRPKPLIKGFTKSLTLDETKYSYTLKQGQTPVYRVKKPGTKLSRFDIPLEGELLKEFWELVQKPCNFIRETV